MPIPESSLLPRCFASTALACALGIAQMPFAFAAPPVDLGTLSAPSDPLLIQTVSVPQGSFEQIFSFVLMTNLGLGGDFSWSISARKSISGFDAILTTGNDTFVASDTPSSPTSSSLDPYPSSLAAGAYRLKVIGVGNGTQGGTFTVALSALAPVASAALPVPEPGTWLMFGAGLLLMGTCVRQKAKTAGLAN